jgi:UPF0755 protein
VGDIILEKVEIDHILCDIQKGDTGRIIAKKLHEQGVIKNELLFRVLIRIKKIDTGLKAGHYLFSGNLNMIDILDLIVSGVIMVERITIPEGYSMFRTFKTLSDRGVGDYERFLELANNQDFVFNVTGFNITNIEGFLYPDTYLLCLNMTEENVIKTMVNNFFSRLYAAHISIDDKEQFYKDLILASIVEREVIFNDEKPLVAGVYRNRLRRNMRLQACPTVTYYLEREFIYLNRLTYSETRNPSPHNTYVIPGLPPTPICSPSVSTIFATLNYETSNYYFFFADRRGRHIYSRTYEEHIKRQRGI